MPRSDPAPREELRTDVIDGVLAVLGEMHTTATPAICRMDVTMSQVKTMLTVATREPATVGQIARLLGVGQPAASTTIDRLVHLGWLDRREDANDRRRAIVRLTEEGRTVVDTIWRVRRDLLRKWVGRLSDEELAQLASGIEALRAVVRNELAEGLEDEVHGQAIA